MKFSAEEYAKLEGLDTGTKILTTAAFIGVSMKNFKDILVSDYAICEDAADELTVNILRFDPFKYDNSDSILECVVALAHFVAAMYVSLEANGFNKDLIIKACTIMF